MWHRKKHFSLTFFLKSSGDGCNRVICYCNIDTYANKNGKISCTKTEEVCVYPASLDGKNCTEGQIWSGNVSEWLCKKNTSSLTFFFKSTDDGCNDYECDCIGVNNVTKIGELTCESSYFEEECFPEEAYNGDTGEFPLLQILFFVSFFPSDATTGEVRGRQRVERRKRWVILQNSLSHIFIHPYLSNQQARLHAVVLGMAR